MILLELSINGAKVALAGSEDMGQIFATIVANGKLGPRSNAVVVGSTVENEVTLNVAGVTARGGRKPDEELTYLETELRCGDVLTLRVVGDGQPTPPLRSEVLDNERMEREEFERSKESYFRYRARFEGNDG